MEVSGLKANDICNIIRTCAKSKVSSIIIGELKINFSTHESEGSLLAPEGTHAGTEEIIEHRTQQELNFELDDLTRKALADLGDAQIMIDNPVEYEAEIASRFLEEGANEENGSQRA